MMVTMWTMCERISTGHSTWIWLMWFSVLWTIKTMDFEEPKTVWSSFQPGACTYSHTLKRTHGLGFYWDVHTLFLLEFNKLELQFHLTIYGWVDSHFNYHLFDRAFSYRFFGSASDAMAYGILLQSHAAIFKDLYFPLEVIIIVRWLQLL